MYIQVRTFFNRMKTGALTHIINLEKNLKNSVIQMLSLPPRGLPYHNRRGSGDLEWTEYHQVVEQEICPTMLH